MAICFGSSLASAISTVNSRPHALTLQRHRPNSFLTSAVFCLAGSSLCRSFTAQCSLAARCSFGSRPEYFPGRISDPSYVRIFDTTLRDGEQSPGVTMNSNEKLAVARLLSRLGVDIIEAGFPASSPDDLETVRSIAIEVGNKPSEDGHLPVICGIARCYRKDIDAAWEAVRHASMPRIHIFIGTSEIHMQHKLRKTREEVVRIARAMVGYARSLGCQDIEFCPEDAGRSDNEFLYHVLEEVIKAGATTLNIADTVGYTIPDEFGQLISDIKANTQGIENVVISTHCQNDLGLATANTLAGARAGARQLEVTINGIGERAGNASLEEVVMAIRCRNKIMGGLYTGINTKHIHMASKLVAESSGLHVQAHKAIVGANAFAHESGIHQDVMLKFKCAYEIMSPDDIGMPRSNDSGIVLGKLGGRHALNSKHAELGYNLSGKELDDVFKCFKDTAEKKKINVSDDDKEALISNEILQPNLIWSLIDLQVTSGTLGLSTATVKLIDSKGVERIACSVGTGPVHAAYEAVNSIVQVPVTLMEYSLTSVTEGIDAVATTRVLIRADPDCHTSTYALTEEILRRNFSGTGADMDIVVSSVRAYINALNKILGFRIQSLNEEPKSELVAA